MRDLQFIVDDRRTGVERLMLCVARVGVAVAFVLIGGSKLNPDPRGMWVALFAQIGFGQWFRYLAGIMQVAGGLLLLSRRTIAVGAVLIGCTMIGASLTDIFVMHAAGVALVPLMLLGIVAALWFSVAFGA